jgi:hypothetical protein
MQNKAFSVFTARTLVEEKKLHFEDEKQKLKVKFKLNSCQGNKRKMHFL